MVVNPDRVLKTIAAIEAGDAKTVRMMLKAGVPANHFVTGMSATDQCSLAHYAAASGQFEIFETLIAAGANIDALQEYSWMAPMSMLECACSARLPSLEIIQKILSEGRPSQDHLNQSLLVACYGHLSIVDAILLAGADPNWVDSTFDTPLIVAILSDCEDVAIRLLEAGADGNGFIKNKDRAPFWKKSIQEAARTKAMNRLVALMSTSIEQAATGHTPKRVRKPKTVEDCWRHIDDWLAKNATNLTLPPPFDFSQPMADHHPLRTPASEQVRLSLQCHDGTGDFAIVDVPEDASYVLLSVEAALEVRGLQRDVMESERTTSDSEWWFDAWWPFAHNGGGDLLVVDCSDGKTAGQVLKFSHESRRVSRFKKSVLDLLQSIAVDIEWRTNPTP
jgi:cell wall assembly regulator SMI1/ankyrin repeat protein